MTELVQGDQVRVMEPTRVDRGFLDCSTVLTVVSTGPSKIRAYWVDKRGRRHNVLLPGEVDKVG